MTGAEWSCSVRRAVGRDVGQRHVRLPDGSLRTTITAAGKTRSQYVRDLLETA